MKAEEPIKYEETFEKNFNGINFSFISYSKESQIITINNIPYCAPEDTKRCQLFKFKLKGKVDIIVFKLLDYEEKLDILDSISDFLDLKVNNYDIDRSPDVPIFLRYMNFVYRGLDRKIIELLNEQYVLEKVEKYES